MNEINLLSQWRSLMASCYTSSFLAIHNHCQSLPATTNIVVASPVLGSGARGAPMLEAVEAATDGLLEVAALISTDTCDTNYCQMPLASDSEISRSSKETFVE